MSVKPLDLKKAQLATASISALPTSVASAEPHPATRIEFHFCAACGAAVPASSRGCLVCGVETRSGSTESQ